MIRRRRQLVSALLVLSAASALGVQGEAQQDPRRTPNETPQRQVQPQTRPGQPPQQRPAQQPQQRPGQRPGRRTEPARPLTPAEQKQRAIENGLVPTIRVKGKAITGYTLAARMKKYRVQGVSIAVINDYGIDWVKTYGIADASSATPADTTTLFQAGATGQVVTAFAALELAETRKLDLDRDVNKMLKTWKVPNSEFTRKRKVTTRDLLTHVAGISITPAPGYEPGAPTPTLAQVLYGTSPAVTRAVVSMQTPGESDRASMASYGVVQMLLEDVTRQPFETFIGQRVLAPLGMGHSSFQQPPGSHAAAGHDAMGKVLPGKWRIYPEQAAAGFWTTPTDLAQVILEIQQVAAGRPGKLLGTESARQVIEPEHVGWPGMGVWLEGHEEASRFRATGSTAGFESELVGYIERGQGAVVMVNTAGGGALIEEIMNAIATAYQWPRFVTPEKTVAKVDTRVFDRFVGRYFLDAREISIVKKGTRLMMGPAGRETTELLPESVSDFFTAEPSATYSFIFDEAGKAQGFTQRQRDGYTRWDRKS